MFNENPDTDVGPFVLKCAFMRSYYYAVHIYSCAKRIGSDKFCVCKICCLRCCGVQFTLFLQVLAVT